MLKLDIIDGVPGIRFPEYDEGLQSRMWASPSLVEKFDEVLSEQIAERKPKERVIVLKDEKKYKIKTNDLTDGKYDIKNTEYERMKYDLDRYNEFAKKQVVTLPLKCVKVTHDFLMQMNL